MLVRTTLTIALLAALPASAQVRDRPARTRVAPAESDAAIMAAGWKALAEGDQTAAARDAGRVLTRTPWNHAALSLRIEALSATDPLQGLDAYERWLGTRTNDDPGLLEPVGRATLRQIAASGDADLRRDAIHLLAQDGLVTPGDAADPVEALTRDAAQARRGDADAAKRLQEAATGSTMNPLAQAQALESAGSAGVAPLMTMLQAQAAPARGAAAAALGRMNAQDAVPAIRALANDPDPFVRMSSTVALARLGDSDAMTKAENMLQSEVPDVQLMAAEAWNGKDGPWVSAITPLLDDHDGTIRLRAARLIAPVNPDLARRTLQDAAADPNPVIRGEAVHVMEQIADAVPGAVSIPELRKLLRDRDEVVRLYAAGTLLAMVRAAPER